MKYTCLVAILCLLPMSSRAENDADGSGQLRTFSQTNLTARELGVLQQFASETNCLVKQRLAEKIVWVLSAHLGLRPPGVHPQKLKQKMTRSDVLDLIGTPNATWATNEYELLSYTVFNPDLQPPPTSPGPPGPSSRNWLVITLRQGTVVDANPVADPDQDGWVKLMLPYLTTGPSPYTNDTVCGEPIDNELRRWIDEGK